MAQKRKHWGQSSLVTHLCHPFVEIPFFLSFLAQLKEDGSGQRRVTRKSHLIVLEHSFQMEKQNLHTTEVSPFHIGLYAELAEICKKTCRKCRMNSHIQIVG